MLGYKLNNAKICKVRRLSLIKNWAFSNEINLNSKFKRYQ